MSLLIPGGVDCGQLLLNEVTSSVMGLREITVRHLVTGGRWSLLVRALHPLVVLGGYRLLKNDILQLSRPRTTDRNSFWFRKLFDVLLKSEAGVSLGVHLFIRWRSPRGFKDCIANPRARVQTLSNGLYDVTSDWVDHYLTRQFDFSYFSTLQMRDLTGRSRFSAPAAIKRPPCSRSCIPLDINIPVRILLLLVCSRFAFVFVCLYPSSEVVTALSRFGGCYFAGLGRELETV